MDCFRNVRARSCPDGTGAGAVRVAVMAAVMCLVAARSGAQRVLWQSDGETGALRAISVAGDRANMNWIMPADGSQYAWVGAVYGWGLGGYTAGGRTVRWRVPVERTDSTVTWRAGELEVTVCRRAVGEDLEETYRFVNVGRDTLRMDAVSLNTPFNDNYPDAQTCVRSRCNAHIWAGDEASYVCAMRMGGTYPHLGLALTEGSVEGYEVWERGRERANSNFRGVLALRTPALTLAPGEAYRLAWRVFAHNGWNDFEEKLVARGGVVASADRYVVALGERVHVRVTDAAGDTTVTRRANVPSPLRVELRGKGGRLARAEVLVVSSVDSLVRRRAEFIVSRQQMRRKGDARFGAYMVYDNEGDSIYLNDTPNCNPVDRDEGRERLGMGIFLARYYRQHGGEHIKASLLDYAAFVRRLQSADHTTWSNTRHEGWNRNYNYAWTATFWLEMWRVTSDRRFLDDAYGTLRALFRQFGHGFYAIDLPVDAVAALREGGYEAEADTLLGDFRQVADTYAANGSSYPKSEVNYEQSIVAPSVIHLLRMYLLTHERRYIDAAREQMPLLEAFGGRQPSFHLHDIAVRHWDGYWFGKREQWGDTFPHYWSTLTAVAFRLWAEATGQNGYAARATGILRQNLCLFTEDGRGSCAYIYPDRVNGRAAAGYDPYANDQDWALCFLLDNKPHAGPVPQTVTVAPAADDAQFDGIGLVNGGGATSVLLKDYSEPQRSQILDMVYRPMFGASVHTLLAEVPGDGNSTQGSMPSHAHRRGEADYYRGYTWWVLREAKRRNPRLTLDAAAWSAPGWIGGGNFWSADAADYYVDWLRGLRDVHGLTLDAIGCRNEKGQSHEFAKTLRSALDKAGFAATRLHAYDNWYDGKMAFLRDMERDTALVRAIDLVSGHVFYEVGAVSAAEREVARKLHKPIWDTEDHVYKQGFDCLISLVECFNLNHIRSGATKIVNWYDIAGIYPLEPYAEEPPVVLAREPWSGHFEVRDALWGYAHYGQFARVGWRYIESGCQALDGGGSVVALGSADGHCSLIFETRLAREPQTVRVQFADGSVPHAGLCQWRSTADAEFVQADDVVPDADGVVTFTLQPHAVYSFSTMRGQQKGGYVAPPSRPFPLPYKETFEQYANTRAYGQLPRYTADIAGAFELAERTDGRGRCVRQVVERPTISWAPDWHPYTILGDSAWSDYEVSADVCLDEGDEGGIMGRVCHVGTGYGFEPKGYLLTLSAAGRVTLTVSRGKKDKGAIVGDAEQQARIRAGLDEGAGGTLVLDSAQTEASHTQWHRLTLRMNGNEVTGLVDGREVVRADSPLYKKGMAGLIALRHGERLSTPQYDNIVITPSAGRRVKAAKMPKAWRPLYELP